MVRNDMGVVSAMCRPWEETENRETATSLKDTGKKARGYDVEV